MIDEHGYYEQTLEGIFELWARVKALEAEIEQLKARRCPCRARLAG